MAGVSEQLPALLRSFLTKGGRESDLLNKKISIIALKTTTLAFVLDWQIGRGI